MASLGAAVSPRGDDPMMRGMDDALPGTPYTSLPAGKASCARCATVIDAATADYSPHGDLICTACAGRQDIEATEGRAVAGMKALAVGNIATGAIAWLLNPMLIVTIGAVVTALIVVRAVHGAWYRPKMSVGARSLATAAAVTGALIGLYPVLGPILLAILL
jgi:hypothetical protein